MSGLCDGFRSDAVGEFLPIEAAFAGVAPLAEAAEFAVVEEFADEALEFGIEHGDFALEGGADGEGFGVGEGDAWSLGGFGAEGALAVAEFDGAGEVDDAGEDEDEAVDYFFVRLGVVADGVGDAGEGAAGVLEEALDLVVVQVGHVVGRAGEDGHDFFSDGGGADGRDFLLEGLGVGGLARDELAVDVGIGGGGAEEFLGECNADFHTGLSLGVGLY